MDKSSRRFLNTREIRLLTLGFIFLAVVFAWPYPSITEKTYYRLKKGMSRSRVRFVIGAPPGDYTNGPTIDDPNAVGKGLVGWGATFGDDVWVGDSGMICVFYDQNDEAELRSFTPRIRVRQSLLENLQWRFERRFAPRIASIRDTEFGNEEYYDRLTGQRVGRQSARWSIHFWCSPLLEQRRSLPYGAGRGHR
jgi:hypothetical protein